MPTRLEWDFQMDFSLYRTGKERRVFSQALKIQVTPFPPQENKNTHRHSREGGNPVLQTSKISNRLDSAASRRMTRFLRVSWFSGFQPPRE
jgi:hypothetical protein